MENNDFSKLKKDNFKVPEGYFEGLEDKVLARLESNMMDPKEIINYLNENADEIELDLLVDRSQDNGNALDLIDTQNNINQDDLLDDINVEELF